MVCVRAHGSPWEAWRRQRWKLPAASKTTLVEPLPPILGTTTMASTPFALLLAIITVAAISVMIFFLMIDNKTEPIHQFFWQTTFPRATNPLVCNNHYLGKDEITIKVKTISLFSSIKIDKFNIF